MLLPLLLPLLPEEKNAEFPEEKNAEFPEEKNAEYVFSFPFPPPIAKGSVVTGDVGVFFAELDLGDGEAGGDSSSDISSKRVSAIAIVF